MFTFWLIPLGKVWNPFSLLQLIKYYHFCSSVLLQGWLWHLITHEGWYAIKNRETKKEKLLAHPPLFSSFIFLVFQYYLVYLLFLFSLHFPFSSFLLFPIFPFFFFSFLSFLFSLSLQFYIFSSYLSLYNFPSLS